MWKLTPGLIRLSLYFSGLTGEGRGGKPIAKIANIVKDWQLKIGKANRRHRRDRKGRTSPLMTLINTDFH